MKSRQDWLEAGLDILGGQGLPGLRIEALCSAVGATRGSFYHHFVDMPGYRVALLEEFELRWTSRLIDHAESIASQGPASQLQVLSDDVVDSLSPARRLSKEMCVPGRRKTLMPPQSWRASTRAGWPTSLTCCAVLDTTKQNPNGARDT